MNLTIAVAQPECTPYDVPANVTSHAQLVRAAKARLMVFPELSLTGYHYDAPVVDADDPALGELIAACTERGTLALVGAPVRSENGGGASIGLLAVSADGARIAYRKRFLGGLEPEHFIAGTEPAVLEVDGWRIGLAVCKDTGIPEHDAHLAELGIDIYAAAVLEHAEDEAVTVRRAERIAKAHDVWVAVASFAGSTGEGYAHAAGLSGVWDGNGTLVGRAEAHAGEWVSVELR
jgi:predicted amidohydrolase